MSQRTFKFSTLFSQAYQDLPAFTDIFDEEGFYLAFVGLTMITIISAIIASRFITLKEMDV